MACARAKRRRCFVVASGSDDEGKGGGVLTLKGGAGNDLFAFTGGIVTTTDLASALNASSVINGGAGDNTIELQAGANAAIGPKVSNIQTVKILPASLSAKDDEAITTLVMTNSQSMTIDAAALGARNSLQIELSGTARTTAIGGAGADLFVAGVRAATMEGGVGNDKFEFLSYADFLGGTDVVNGGAGQNTVYFYSPETSSAKTITATGMTSFRDIENFDFVAPDSHSNAETRLTIDNSFYEANKVRAVTMTAQYVGLDLNASAVTNMSFHIDGPQDLFDTDMDVSTGSGSDTLVGGDGNDILNAGAGVNTLTGGGGDNTFVFNQRFGVNTITDFGAGDVLSFNHADFDSFAAVMAHAATSGANTVIAFDGDDKVTLLNFARSDLTASMFKFT